MPIAIEAHNLSKSFRGNIVAVSGLDLEVPTNSVYGLIGRNGAGKTTTLRLLMGLLKPDSGSSRLLGADFQSAPQSMREKVGYVSQSQQLPGWMTLNELCRYVSYFYSSWDQAFADVLTRRWELPGNRPIQQLSGGQQRQAAVLIAIASRPQILLLDEPAAGLDPVARRSFLTAVIEAIHRSPGCTVLLSTHYIGDLQRIADYIGIMDRGRLIQSAKLDFLMQTMRKVQVIFPDSSVPPEFEIPGALTRSIAGPVVTSIVELNCEEQLNPLYDHPGVRVNTFPLGLEELFVEWQGATQPNETVNSEEDSTGESSLVRNIHFN